MIKWMAGVFGGSVDPLMSALNNDRRILEEIRHINSTIATLRDSTNQREDVLGICRRINESVGTSTIKPLQKSLPEYDLLAHFLEAILSVFDITPPADITSITLCKTLVILLNAITSPPNLSQFYRASVHLCIIFYEQPEYSLFIDDLFGQLLRVPSFAVSLSSPDLFEVIVCEVFCRPELAPAVSCLIRHLSTQLFEIPPYTGDSHSTINTFLAAVEHGMLPVETKVQFAIFFTYILAINSVSDTTLAEEFHNSNGLEIMLKLVSHAAPSAITSIFHLHAIIPRYTLNTNVLQFIFSHAMEGQDQIRASFIKVITRLIEKKQLTPDCVYTPTLFMSRSDMYPQTDEALSSLFCTLSNHEDPNITLLLTHALAIFTSGHVDQEQMQSHLSSIMERGTDNGQDILIVLSESKRRRSLISSLYAYPEFAEICVKTAISPVFVWAMFQESDLAPSPTRFAQLLCQTFIRNATAEVAQELMNMIGQNPTDKNISILVACFFDSEQCSSAFIKAGGLDWINHHVPEKLLAVFFSSLLHYKDFQELSYWITEQPLDHPVFSLSPQHITQIIYTHGGRLKVPPLLALLPPPEYISPYNAYLASKWAIREILRRNGDIDGPLCVAASNRYLTPKQFNYIWENSSKLSLHVDPSMDHFSLFEFNAGDDQASLGVPGQFKAIIFWFKALGSPHLMFADNCTVSIQDNQLRVAIEDAVVFIPVKPQNWNMVSISLVSKGAEVRLNNISKKLQIQNISTLSKISFGSTKDSFLLGHSILLFNSAPSNYSQFFCKGPGHVKYDIDGILITPETPNLDYLNGVFCVPYNGFPQFLKERFHFLRLIKEIIEGGNIERVDDLINVLLNLHRIDSTIEDFWTQMKIVLKERNLPETKVYQILSLLLNNSENNEDVISMMSDYELWIKYPGPLKSALIREPQLVNDIHIGLTIVDFVHMNPSHCESFVSIVLAAQNQKLMDLLARDFLTRVPYRLEFLRLLGSRSNPSEIEIIARSLPFSVAVEQLFLLEEEECKAMFEVIMRLSAHDPTYADGTPVFAFALLRHLLMKEVRELIFAMILGYPTYITQNVTLEIVRPQLATTFTIVMLSSAIIFSNMVEINFPEFENEMSHFLNLACSLVRSDYLVFLSDSTLEAFLQLSPGLFDIYALEEPDPPAALATMTPQEYRDRCTELLTAWGLPSSISDEISHQIYAPTPYTSVAILLTSYITALSEGKPASITHKDKHKPLLNYLDAMILSFAQNPNKFAAAISCIIMQDKSPISQQFVAELIVSLACSPVFHECSIVTLEFFFKTVHQAILKNLLGNLNLLSCTLLPVIQAIPDACSSQSIVKDLRGILLETLKHVDTNSQTITMMESMASFLFGRSNFFLDFDFSSVFFFRLLELLESNSLTDNDGIQALMRLINYMIKEVIHTQSYRDEWSLHHGLVGLLGLTKFSVGVFNSFQKGKNGFLEWAKENKSVYKGVIDCLMSKTVDLNERTDPITVEIELKYWNSIPYQVLMVHHRAVSNTDLDSYVIEHLVKYHIDLNYRKIEKEFSANWMKNQLTCFQDPDQPHFKSLRLSPFAWPMKMPRIVSPSPYFLPTVLIDKQMSNEAFKSVAGMSCDFSEDSMFPREYTPFIDLMGKTIPTDYSQSKTSIPSLLFRQFVSTYIHDNNFHVHSVKFLKYSDPLDSVAFILSDSAYILLNATQPTQNTLKLDSTSTSPPLYSNLIQTAALGFFGITTLFCGHPVISFKFSSLISVRHHLFNHKPRSISLTTRTSAEFILVFEDGIPGDMYKNMSSAVNSFPNNCLWTLTLNSATKNWVSREMSTAEYLLFLNAQSSRSFSDVSQYPIFPQVISDFDNLPPTKFRDLTKPMGQQSSARAEVYEKMYTESGTHFYGSHYSMASSVHRFLARLVPFTYLHWDLHNGWDSPQRMFDNVERTWLSASQVNVSDVTEFTPEMFMLAEIYESSNILPLPKGSFPVNVKLPEWSKGPEHYSQVSLRELENSEKVNEWIDLIFGHLQTGQGAIQHKNLFLPVSYHTCTDIDDATLSLQLAHWGQVPIQLFKKPHPQRQATKKQSQVSKKGLEFDLNISNISSTRLAASGLFAVCDTLNGTSFVLSLETKDGILVPGVSYPRFVHPDIAKSVVNGEDFICASFYDKTLVLWDFIRATLHRLIETSSIIKDVSFDEQRGWLWVLEKRSLSCYTVNGKLLDKIDSSNEFTSISTLNLPMVETDRPVFTEVTGGTIVIYKFDILQHKIIQESTGV